MYSKEEAKKLRLEFWEQFGRRCEAHPLLRHKRKKWMLHRTKIKGVALRFETGRENAMVMIELNHKNEDKRLKAFEILERYKPVLEEGFPKGMEWEFYHQREDSRQEVCRIYTTLEKVDLHRQHHWPDIFNFFIENMVQLEKNFLQIRDLLKEELNQY
ncbi:MAG: DUF4268 domain-containing protein [Prolixibacteraceae bacterium]